MTAFSMAGPRRDPRETLADSLEVEVIVRHKVGEIVKPVMNDERTQRSSFQAVRCAVSMA